VTERPSLNWGAQFGPLGHTRHRLKSLTSISDESGLGVAIVADSLSNVLWEFEHFNGRASLALCRTEMIDGEKYAFFDAKGPFGFLSDLFNAPAVPVRIRRLPAMRLVVGDTCDRHMLVGQRRWWVETIGSSTLLLKTESYDYARGRRNRAGMVLLGARRQMRVWTDYFKNIRDAYQRNRFCANATFAVEELELNEWLEHGIAHLHVSLGAAPSPWPPDE
jgi:hypothetical protein